jgi:hypothetical protein
LGRFTPLRNLFLNNSQNFAQLSIFLEICLLKKRIQERILDYFSSEIASLVPLTDYIIDFSVDPFSEYIKVIELNPWCEAASSALFDWNDPEDKV